MNEKEILKRYGKKLWRISILFKDIKSKASILVYPHKKYGKRFGYELIEKYKSEIEVEPITI